MSLREYSLHHKLAALLGAVALVGGLYLFAQVVPVHHGLDVLERWIQDWGLWAPVVLLLAYVLAGTLMLPTFPLTVMAGVLFGVTRGSLLICVGWTLTSTLGFVIARYVARERVAAFLRSRPGVCAVDQAISDHQWKIVALVRLSPILPFNVCHYLFGLSGVRFGPYLCATALTSLAPTILYTYLGDRGKGLLQHPSSVTQWALLGLGVAATVGLAVWATGLAHRAIARKCVEAKPVSAPPDPAHPLPALTNVRG